MLASFDEEISQSSGDERGAPRCPLWERPAVGPTSLVGEEVRSQMDILGPKATADQLHAFLRRLGYDLSPAETQKLFDRLDVNRDGRVSTMEMYVGLMDWDKVFYSKHWPEYIDRAFDR